MERCVEYDTPYLLRDRWLEEVNAGNARIEPAGKYDLGRRIENMAMQRPAMLEAA
mgnify:CR=1 FL=1